MKTKDDALIAMTYRGVRHGPADVIKRMEKGEAVDPRATTSGLIPCSKLRPRPTTGSIGFSQSESGFVRPTDPSIVCSRCYKRALLEETSSIGRYHAVLRPESSTSQIRRSASQRIRKAPPLSNQADHARQIRKWGHLTLQSGA